MERYDVNKRNYLGKVRKKSTAVLILADFLSMIFFWVVSMFADELSLTPEYAKILKITSYVSIFALVIIMFILIVVITGPSYVIQNDLMNIYIVKKHNKIITIPVTELKKIRSRVKSGEKAKKTYGTIIIITTNKKRYRVRNIYNVNEVRDDIIRTIEKLQIYYEGVRQGSKEYEETLAKLKEKE